MSVHTCVCMCVCSKLGAVHRTAGQPYCPCCACCLPASPLPLFLPQTGAGKTFTMSGDARNYSHRGIIPRAMQHVFREVDLRSDRIYNIAVSYLEIYNESLRDLLADDPAASDSLAILDDAANTVVSEHMYIPAGCMQHALATTMPCCCCCAGSRAGSCSNNAAVGSRQHQVKVAFIAACLNQPAA